MKRLVRLYGAFQFFFGLLFWVPIFYEYQVRQGLSAAEILAIQSIYQVAFSLMEIPTGWYADRFGYLASLRVGSFTLIVANLLPIYWPTYIGFLVHFLLIALSRSFISGASSAYLYEALRLQGASERYKEVEGSTRSLSLVGKVIGWAGVGALMQWHLTLPYWLTFGAAVFALIFARILPELSAKDETISVEETKAPSLVGAALKELRSNRLLLLLMFQGVAIFVLSRVAQVTLFQPILTAKAVPIAWHGAVMSAMTVFEALGSWKPDFAKRWMSDLNAVTILTIVLAVCLGAIPFLGLETTVISLCLFSLAVGLSFPVQKQVMNDAIVHPRYRATLLSIESIIDRTVSALVTLVLARYMANGLMNGFLIQSGIATVLLALVIAVLANRVRKKPASI